MQTEHRKPLQAVHISGCSDSLERVAEVEAENKAKREERAKQREENLERSREVAEEQKQIREYYYQKEIRMDVLYSSITTANIRIL